jgi:diacylglycerol kinase (ATP)
MRDAECGMQSADMRSHSLSAVARRAKADWAYHRPRVADLENLRRQSPTEVLPILVAATAGAGAGRDLEPYLRALIAPHFDPRFVYSATLHELKQVIDEIVRSGASRVAVAGGDGTLHRVVNALGDARMVVAPIPTGSGNDFCRGIGLTTDPAIAVAALARGTTRRVDLVEVNGRRVCTVAGLGLVADTGVHVASLLAPGSPWRSLGRRLGDLAYLGAAAIRLLLHPRIAGAARVAWREADGRWRETRRRLHGIMIANLQTLGAGLRVPVPGQPDDGAFELVQVIEGSRLTLARALSSLRSERPIPAGVLEVARAVEATIEWEGGSRLLADGEDLGRAARFDVRVLPGALEVPRYE